MNGTMSGREPPPCYNCGMRGHIFTACPEPTRATPAGLEASRARQQAGSGRSDTDHPNKRHKGPIVTRYTQPPPAHLPANHFPAPIQNYSYGPPQPYPPGPVPPHPLQGQHGHGYLPQQPPPPPHTYGYGQPSSGPGTIPPAAGHPAPYTAFPPPLGHPPPGYPQMAPFGFQAPPPGVHGPPVIPPVNFHPPEYRAYTGLTPPPPSHSGYTSYDPQHKRASEGYERSPVYGENQRLPHNRYTRDSWSDRRNDKPDYHSREDDRFSRGRSRDERRQDRDRQDNRRSFDHRKPHRAPTERHGHRGNRDRLRSFSRPRSNRSVDSESHTRLPISEIPDQLPHHEMPGNDLPSYAIEADARPKKDFQPSEGYMLTNTGQVKAVNERMAFPSEPAKQEADSREPLSESDIPHASDQALEPEADFLDDYEAAFCEIVSTNQGDAIAEPLPGEYTDEIMLPPAFDAKCVKSKLVTVSNLDDFALSVRDTNRWPKYRNHPAFLPPGEVNLASLELYVVEVHKTQNRHEKRGRGPQGQYSNRDQGRHQKINNADRMGKNKRHIASFDRKRKWDDHMHDPTEFGSTYAGNNTHSQEPSRRVRQFSPEPGEISDTPTSSAIPVEQNWLPASTSQQAEASIHNGAMLATHRDFSGHLGPRHDTYIRNDSYEHRPLSGTGYHHDPSRSTDRERIPMRSPSPYTRGRHPQKLTTPQGERAERSVSQQTHEHSDGPLLDELQSHIDKVCSSTVVNTPAKTPKQDAQKGRIHHPLPPRPPVNIPSPRETASSERGHYTTGRPVSRNEAAATRTSTPDPGSPPSEPGSPLTRIEAELLGLVGADEEDEPEIKSPKKEPDNAVVLKRKQRKVHSAYDRRW